MRIGILGANFKSCSLTIRESLAKACQRRLSCLNKEAAEFCSVILSTCNRIEIYFSASELADVHTSLLAILKEEIDLPFEHHLYSYFGIDCFLHLAEVTAGLDSAILAETDIQRQVKQAYQERAASYFLPSCIHYLFQKSLHLGKCVRSQCEISPRGSTLPQLLFDMSVERIQEIRVSRILLIGYSEINRQVISFLKYKGCQDLTLCSRSSLDAQEFARKEGLSFLPWLDRKKWVEFTWVIAGSNAPGYVIEEQEGKIETKIISDLSIPRTVAPKVSSQVVIYDMEALVDRIARSQKTNQEIFVSAKNLLIEKTRFYERAFLAREREVLACV